jgi:monoamine oxidase
VPTYDLAIVGAGAAGLAAARRAQERGLSFVLFEAMDRIGGRAHTDTATFGVPWDRGCHWLHSASVNPMRALADRYGFRYRAESAPWRIRRDGRWVTDEETDALDAGYDRLHHAVRAAAEVGQDISIADVLDQTDPAYPLYRTSIHAEWGVGPAEASTLDAMTYRDTDENWPLQDGYGALVARHAAGIPVELNTPVDRIAWSGPLVKLTTSNGTVESRAVIVTVSTNVLADEVIAFDPPLPAWKLETAASVPLGRANKVAFAIKGDYLEVDSHASGIFSIDADNLMSFQLRPFGADLANGYLAGPLCKELETAGTEEMLAASRAALVNAYGSGIVKHITAQSASRWGAEPWIRGAYAAALPGRAHLRARLAEPLADRLYFAGEATHGTFFSTCHGAHESGEQAVETVEHSFCR